MRRFVFVKRERLEKMRPAGTSSAVGSEQTMQDEHGWTGALRIPFVWAEASARTVTVLGPAGPTAMRAREAFGKYREGGKNRSMLVL